MSYRASATAGTKVVDMNTALLAETEDDQKKDIETGKPDVQETAITMPEEKDTSTLLTEAEADPKNDIETGEPDVNETKVEMSGENKATTSTVETPAEGGNESNSPPANSEGSPGNEIPQKDTEINAIP